jgi:hypothetical protein
MSSEPAEVDARVTDRATQSCGVLIGGIFPKEKSARLQSGVVPKGVRWIGDCSSCPTADRSAQGAAQHVRAEEVGLPALDWNGMLKAGPDRSRARTAL